jgi:hypothetical protein
LLRQLKAAGRKAIRIRLFEVLAAMGRCADDAALSKAVHQAFEAADALPWDSSQSFGGLAAIQVRRLPHHPDRFGAVLTVGLSCGSDGSLSLYERTRRGMRVAVTAESNDYASIQKGRLSLVYGVSPPDARGRYFVVTAHGRPWCSSLWRGLHYHVLEPGPHPSRPRRLLQKEASARHDSGEPGFIETTRTGFTIRFYSWHNLATEVIRTHVRRYERRGARFVRVQPFAAEPRDLADEWLSLPWSQASRLTHPTARARLAAVHARLVAAERADYAPSNITVDPGSTAGRPVLRFSCPTCTSLPKRLAFHATADGDGYVLTDVH